MVAVGRFVFVYSSHFLRQLSYDTFPFSKSAHLSLPSQPSPLHGNFLSVTIFNSTKRMKNFVPLPAEPSQTPRTHPSTSDPKELVYNSTTGTLSFEPQSQIFKDGRLSMLSSLRLTEFFK